jgi:hypothetical protein
MNELSITEIQFIVQTKFARSFLFDSTDRNLRNFSSLVDVSTSTGTDVDAIYLHNSQFVNVLWQP